MPHSAQHTVLLSNNMDTIPNINAGPALLQKDSIRWACSLRMTELRKAECTVAAPTGYPPKNPKSRRDSAPSGIWQILESGRKRGLLTPPSRLLIIADRKKKGKSEGIMVFKLISTPSWAERMVGSASKISSIIQSAEREREKILFV